MSDESPAFLPVLFSCSCCRASRSTSSLFSDPVQQILLDALQLFLLFLLWSAMSDVLQSALMSAARRVEEHIDNELEKLDNLNDTDLEVLRQQKLEGLRKSKKEREQWLSQGHGEYSELAEEKHFFDVSKQSERCVVHFYRDETFRCKIFDKHLEILARKHVETRFCKINADKCPFLTQRLKIRVIPTLALILNAKTRDYIVGFSDLGNCDDFSTEMLEWRLARSDLIHYSGDLLNAPDNANKGMKVTKVAKKTIRGGNKDEESDEDDW